MSNKYRYKSPRGKYSQAKAQASFRNEEFEFEYNDWIVLWMQKDYWNNMGTGSSQYKMYRIDGSLPWRTDNVIISANKGNNVKAINQPGHETRRKIKYGTGHSAKCKPLMADGIQYKSLIEAGKKLNMWPTGVKYKVKSKNYPNWYMIKGDNQ